MEESAGKHERKLVWIIKFQWEIIREGFLAKFLPVIAVLAQEYGKYDIEKEKHIRYFFSSFSSFSLSLKNKRESEKGKELECGMETTFHPVDCFQACYYQYTSLLMMFFLVGGLVGEVYGNSSEG